MSRHLGLAHPSIEDARGFVEALRDLVDGGLPRGVAAGVVIGVQDGVVESARLDAGPPWLGFGAWVRTLQTWVEPRLPRGWHGSLRLHLLDGRLLRLEVRRVLR